MSKRVFFSLGAAPIAIAAILVATTALAQTQPPPHTQPTVPVTVTITSVTNVAGGDIASLPDYFTRINIDGSWFQSAVVAENASPTPGWSFTRSVPRGGGFVPIRIEIKDNDDPFPWEDVDVDPAVCPQQEIQFGCATITIGRPPVDYMGLDLSFDPATNAVNGDASSASACTTGTERGFFGLGQTATVCFTITVGTPNAIVVTKTSDSNDDCSLTDCSLREAVAAAQNGDTIMLNALGHPYKLEFRNWDPTRQDPTRDDPGHLKITQQNLTILGPKTGASVVIEQTQPDARVFDVHGSGSVNMSNLTIRGGVAGNTSTALPGHVHGGGIHNHGIVHLTNVTLTGNHAPVDDPVFTAGGGGGIWNAGVMTLKHVTIAGNDAAIIAGGLGGVPATLTNTLLASNLGPDGADGDTAPDPVNCAGTPIDNGGNLQFPGSTCPFAGAPLATSPVGASLAPDSTFWLIPGSRAIDVGPSTGCAAPTDQAGVPRPLDGNGDGDPRCDSGATEYDPHGLGVIHQPLDSTTGQPGPVTLAFDNVTTAGTSTLTTSGTGPARPAGYREGSPLVFYDVRTQASYAGSVNVCIDYAGVSFANETGLRLFQHAGGAWQDVTLSLDSAANVICARTATLGVFGIFRPNLPPVASIAEPAGGYRLNEGGNIVLQGSGFDADGDPLTYEWTPATELDDRTLATPRFSPHDEGTRTFTLIVRDGDSSSTPATTTVRVDNAAPTMTLTGPVTGSLYRVGAPVSVTATFADAGVDDVHTCKVDWDNGAAPQAGTVTESNGAGSCAATRTITAAGVYTLQVTVDDGDGGTATATTTAVVYDPNAGFVAGSGFIPSPVGAYRPSPGAGGNVTFAFLAQYQKDATLPSGATNVRLPGGVRFVSTSYEWLVVTGPKAQFKGVGRLNETGSYGFLLTAYDGQLPGGGGSDRFRLKIWNRVNGQLVYDNVLDPTATDDIDRAKPQPIGSGGTIAIVKA